MGASPCHAKEESICGHRVGSQAACDRPTSLIPERYSTPDEIPAASSKRSSGRPGDMLGEETELPAPRFSREIGSSMPTESYSERYFSREAAELAHMWESYAHDNDDESSRTRRRHAFSTGATYDGTWLGNERDGCGTQVWPDGARYIGQWKSNRANGIGFFHNTEGDEYFGEWYKNSIHGQGVYRHRDGTMYEGQFLNDRQDGLGVERWQDGSIFAGEFSIGKKRGVGVYRWSDGSEYAGQWRMNQIDGAGAYRGVDGRSFAGGWILSMKHGCGRYKWPDGRSFQGQYIRDWKDGFGVFLFADGTRYQGWWREGEQLNGVFGVIEPDARTLSGIRESEEWCDMSNAPSDVSKATSDRGEHPDESAAGGHESTVQLRKVKYKTSAVYTRVSQRQAIPNKSAGEIAG